MDIATDSVWGVLGARAVVSASEKRKISYTYQKSKHASSVVLPFSNHYSEYAILFAIELRQYLAYLKVWWIFVKHDKE